MNRRRSPAGPGQPAVPESKRCAIYTRQSVSASVEQDFTSLDAQREACERYIQNQAALGWTLIQEQYNDGGFTGANIERPAFQRLLADIDAGKIAIVVCYKVDRVSRSLLDFAKLMERFAVARVALVSVTQNFSTADAMGRLTLNMLMSFAEFERSMIAERTRDKITMARRRGKWTGGPTPLGYDVVDRKLVVNEAESAVVRRAYDLYLEHRSATAVARVLNAEHRTTKRQVSRNGNGRGARDWDKASVLHLLRNPTPAGLMSCGVEVHEGEHEAIVEQSHYERIQHLLDEGRSNGVRHGRNPEYFLTGIIRCARCGQAFTPASSRRGERTYRYYRCSTRDKRGRDACESGPLPAAAIEDFVVLRIREELADGTFVEEVTEAVRERIAQQRGSLQAEREGLPSQIARVSTEGKRLVESASRIEGTGRRLLDAKLQEVGDQLGRLEARLAEVQRRLMLLEDARVEAEWVASCLAGFNRVWDSLSPENRGRLVRAVVTRVEVDEPNGDVRVFLADLGPAPEVEGVS